jgi:hypothetical protein
MAAMSDQSIKPTVILPDTTPLVDLAAVDAPHLLNDLGRVVVVDVVALEATYFVTAQVAPLAMRGRAR